MEIVCEKDDHCEEENSETTATNKRKYPGKEDPIDLEQVIRYCDWKEKCLKERLL